MSEFTKAFILKILTLATWFKKHTPRYLGNHYRSHDVDSTRLVAASLDKALYNQ